MANSFVQYTGDGTTRVFSVPFQYLDRSHVKVTVDGVNKAFSWLASNSIRLTAVPANDTLIDIRRKTPNAKPLVDFKDNSTITEADLDKLAYQQIFLSQEAIDLFNQVNGTADGLVDLVQDALAAVAGSEALAQEAVDKATNAEMVVLSTSSEVNVNAAQVLSNAEAAALAKTTAETAANTAISNAGLAGTKATEAAASAAAAAASAAAAAVAANFNPEDFYTRVQMDGLLATTTFNVTQVTGLDAAIAGKADIGHNHTVGQVSGLQSILDGKLGATASAASAAKLTTARTISLAGDASGSVSFDGSANATITVAVADDSHNHIMANVDGLTTALAAKAATTTTITAGNGLTGGGALSANRIISLGTPGNITNATTNSVGSETHTHALGFIAAEVSTTSSAGATSFPVGHFVNSVVTSLPDRNESQNVRLDANDATRYHTGGSGTALSGTWRSRGIATSSLALFQRVA